jgi:hypothetical protein
MKNKRPMLDKSITLLDFKQFYWEKIELIAFCRVNVLTTQGSKLELEARIELFLTSGEKKPFFLKKPRKGRWDSEKFSLTRDTVVINYKSAPITRAFFLKEIGGHFRFKADVFTWIKTKLKNEEDLTYGDIIDQWEKIEQLKQDANYARAIPKQFQFNQFMKDWKDAKAGAGAKEAWKFIRSLPGETTYAHYVDVINQEKTS